jgi:DNA primase
MRTTLRLALPTSDYHFSRAAVEYALTELGVDCRFGPKEAVVQCVFASETGKHLYINLLDKPGVAHCFRCGARANFQEFVKAYSGMTNVHAAMFLARCRRATAAADYEPPIREKKKVGDDDERLRPYWFRHPYVYDRGITEETCKRFSVGYDRENNAITFPWFDRTGKLIAIKKRSILDKFYSAEADTDTSSTLFGMNLARQHGYLWVTEGEFDCLFLDQCFRLAHFDNHFALALGGTMLRTQTIVELCKRQPERIVLLLDNDDAGAQATAVIRKQLLPHVKLLQPSYPSGVNDPNELRFEQVVQLVRSLDMKGQSCVD